MRRKVFVYGTLMRGEVRNTNLARDVYLGRGRIRGTLHNVGDGGFPAAMGTTRGQWIHGEVWEVSDATLRVLDGIEGFFPSRESQSMYLRRRVLVHWDEFDNGVYADAYFWNAGLDMIGDRIESGDWRERPVRRDAPDLWKQGGESWSW